MAVLNVQQAKRAANSIVMASADTNGDSWANTGSEALLVENASGAAVTLTFTTTATVDGLPVQDLQVVVPNGETHLLGPFPPSVYNDPDGNAQVSYSAATGVKVAVVKVA